ncbi:hypothetical protein [Legionella gresilensis]|uniref:hypothetical protein n=1 Tax=Legionella gresilensis TaxID=91823 RepID=UPI0010415734|nr:hypothetical protein [Legionella gresilensis]
MFNFFYPNDRVANLDLRAFKKCQWQEKLLSITNQEVVKFPEYKILNGSNAATHNEFTCCVFILFSRSNPIYFLGHFNSVNYGESRNLFHNDFQEILTHISANRLSLDSYEAILIGGDKSLFEAISNYLSSLNIKITASYFDNYHAHASVLDDALLAKHVIFDYNNYRAYIYSAEFPNQVLPLSNSHVTFERDFSFQKGMLITLMNEALSNLFEESSDDNSLATGMS